jgi:hypothetical protein
MVILYSSGEYVVDPARVFPVRTRFLAIRDLYFCATSPRTFLPGLHPFGGGRIGVFVGTPVAINPGGGGRMGFFRSAFASL